MSRELIEFSNLIDEQFEPDTTVTDELWSMIQGWLAPQPSKGGALKSVDKTDSSNKIAA